MFMMAKEAALNLGLEMTPSSLLSDYEQALRNSIRLNFPVGEISEWGVQLSRVFSCCSTSNWTLETIISYW